MAIRLSSKRCEEIKKLAVETLERCNVCELPIDPFKMASRMGVKIDAYSSLREKDRARSFKLSTDGYWARGNNGALVIAYNDSKIIGRTNFTLMHEIGHIVLDHTEDSELAEKEASFFAKFALAPPILIDRLNLKDPVKISKVFGLSLEVGRYARVYYQKWLCRPNPDYADYEKRILELFSKYLNH